ncbi:MAG TPA: hypothetical protein VGN15_12380, partial [Ktedonobacteraceae bacterium]|nr:hypothetical protein [Ktedonobacteraceae bacterium]
GEVFAREEERKGGSIKTYTGIHVYPLDARVEEIDLEDIAHALSNLCRYTGHTSKFYSVGEHSVRVSEYLEGMSSMATARVGLLHDATEAYLNDIARPIKHSPGFGPAYRTAEQRLYEVIAQKFDLPKKLPEVVHHADDTLLVTEMRDLMGVKSFWPNAPEPLSGSIEPWTPARAKKAFLNRYQYLTKE